MHDRLVLPEEVDLDTKDSQKHKRFLENLHTVLAIALAFAGSGGYLHYLGWTSHRCYNER